MPATDYTREQIAELEAAMDRVMRTCAGRPKGDWREAATRYCDDYGYQETLEWLGERIGACGSSGFGPEPDYSFQAESLSSEVRIYSHRLKETFTLKRGAFLRIVFPNPTKAHQMSLF